MYVAKVPNRGSPPAVLLRESYREAGKVKNRTLANLSSWPEAKVDALARVLKGQLAPAAAVEGAFEISRSLPHGHVAAVLGALRDVGLEALIDPGPSRQRDLVTAMAVAQVIAPGSKLAIARGLQAETAASSLGEALGAGGCDEDDLYAAMDWLAAGRLREDVGPAGLDWITARRAPQVKALVRDGALQLSLFDEQDLAEITSPDFPGERLVACKNPLLEAERARKRESLLQATEADLAKIAAAVQRERRPLRGTDKIALRADRVLRRRKVAKHFTTSIAEDHFSYARNQDSITAEAALDGIYVLRTSVPGGDLGSGEVVASYKSLAQVERAFRAFNTDLDIRPIRHRTETRVRTHVFLRMLSYYITWHMHDRLAPLLFTDDDKAAAEAARPSPVAPAARSPRALAKAAAKRTPAGLPVHSLDSLLADLATICLNQIQPADPALPAFCLVTTPTPLQRQALDLLGVSHRLGIA